MRFKVSLWIGQICHPEPEFAVRPAVRTLREIRPPARLIVWLETISRRAHAAWRMPSSVWLRTKVPTSSRMFPGLLHVQPTMAPELKTTFGSSKTAVTRAAGGGSVSCAGPEIAMLSGTACRRHSGLAGTAPPASFSFMYPCILRSFLCPTPWESGEKLDLKWREVDAEERSGGSDSYNRKASGATQPTCFLEPGSG